MAGRGIKCRPEMHDGDDHPLLFELAERRERELRVQSITVPLWTEQKARLVAEYVRLFTFVTKHGAYIDGFAGPHTDKRDGCWAAEAVLGIRPAFLRSLFLCELDGAKVAKLRALRDGQPAVRGRAVEIVAGDFNRTVDRILGSGAIGPKVAAFALLDQHSFECDWATVRKLAAHKPPGERKIELFYFVPTGWLGRGVAGFHDPAREMLRWWGREDWKEMVACGSHERGVLFTRRMREELGYRFAWSWPVRRERGEGRFMYHMIHASDHPEAPKLMARAYRRATISPGDARQFDFDLGLVEP